MAAVRKRLPDDDEDNVALLCDESILSAVTEFIPSGFPNLDRILGGGWPVGRASEVFGPEAAGKSALAHQALRSVQALGGTAIYIDFEAALEPGKMSQLGIDPGNLIYVSPKHIEQAWDIIWTTLDTLEKSPPEAPVLIVWDSVGASIPKAELEAESSGDSQVGVAARAMSKGCRRMFRAIARTRAHMMWINQERETIGAMGPAFMKPISTTGGRALRYAATLRVRCQRKETLASGNVKTGYRIQCTTIKCRLAPPHQKAQWILDFTYGPSPELTIFDILLAARVLKVAPKPPHEKEVCYASPWHKSPFTRHGFLELHRTDGAFRDETAKAVAALDLSEGSDE